MWQNRNNGPMRPKQLNLDSVVFSMFTSDEIRRLSVVKVVTSSVLDNLGHPLSGGLYDLAMGGIG